MLCVSNHANVRARTSSPSRAKPSAPWSLSHVGGQLATPPCSHGSMSCCAVDSASPRTCCRAQVQVPVTAPRRCKIRLAARQARAQAVTIWLQRVSVNRATSLLPALSPLLKRQAKPRLAMTLLAVSRWTRSSLSWHLLANDLRCWLRAQRKSTRLVSCGWLRGCVCIW